MIYLLITVLLNTLLVVIFKLFDRFKVDNLQAIIINYLVCVVTGSLFFGNLPISYESISKPWFPLAAAIGIGFIIVFNLFAFCTKKYGITTATVANKLSLVIPVFFSVFLYSESLSIIHILGVVLAIPAVIFVSNSIGKDENSKKIGFKFGLTALLFLGSGLLDTGMKYVQHSYLESKVEQSVFAIHLFAVAGCIGSIILLILIISKKVKLRFRNILGGILLGIPNYFSIYFMLLMLNSNFIKSSALIPLCNIGVLFVSSLTAILLFKEQMNRIRWVGLGLSVVVMLLLAKS